ncbi:hypothetical protein PQX77_003418 [Marasmius sp. AFHP31]|nr:hypothetical protein PQX77_003418 [Marasmius sp. AFHP31]
MLSRFFHKARNFQITGGSFNHVQGDQHNHNYTTTIVQAKEEEPSEFDEYFKVKLGGILKLRDVGSSAYPRQWDDGRREWGRGRTSYSGPDAHRAFLEDFRMLSGTLTSNVSQIYGYSKSSIPSLLLYHNLAPASRLWADQHISLEWNGKTEHAWMSQAWRVFHNRGIALEDDLNVYYLVCPSAKLDSEWLKPSEVQLKRQSQQPIYLFVRPPPSDFNYNHHKTSSLYYWSFHEDGRSPLSPDTCRGLGLPAELVYRHSSYATSWFNKDYKRIHQYQLLRGFDPSTTDFARHLEYDGNLFQPVNDSDRFQIHRGSPPESRSSTPTPDIWKESEDSAVIEPILASTTSGTRLGHTGFSSPAFRPSPAEVSSELATTTGALDLDVD